ncbi:MAG TPA: NRDE family protein, partial [Balneolaceae bacterium]|nr:NRDE family protein [Balneolaceae bacterium]
MCLILFAFKQHPKFDLILAANRDELYKRPTHAAQFWDEDPDLLAGKDLSAGGTWMGINRRGQVAALTNYRDPSISKKNPPSRGNIVRRYLMDATDTMAFLKNLDREAHQYMGFNFLAGTTDKIYHYSNQEGTINPIKPGIHGISNHLLDTPWPKVERAKSQLNTLLRDDTLTTESLFNLLKDDQQAPDEQLPDTGIPRELEKKISPIFIKTEEYGTRCSTVLLIDKDEKAIFEEHQFKPGTMKVDQ